MNLRHDLVARDGSDQFRVRWHAPDRALGMFTAVLRVKNEAVSLPWVLPGLLDAVEAVVVVDNGSEDDTAEVARRVAKEHDAEERLQVLDYPFEVAKCGPDHLATPPDSVHSLTYFYNWAFSQVRTPYCLKWDGDMVLTVEGERAFEELRWQLEGVDAIIHIPRYPVYVESDDVAFIDARLSNREPWGWPNKAQYHHGKGLEWEVPLWPRSTPTVNLDEWTCFELKWLDADEFQHWSTTEFASGVRTQRKAREWQVFHALRRGECPFGVQRVESPGATHVVDLLRRPESARFVLDF